MSKSDNRYCTLRILVIGIEDKYCESIGIKKEDLNHIFDRFWQAEKSRHQKGLGLGLSLAETIVKLHRGTISVESELGRGTTFEITLPLNVKK